MQIKYYIDKTPPAEHSLKRNIVPDAKRTENFTSLPWRTQSASLWRHLPYSSILQKAESKESCPVRPIPAYKAGLYGLTENRQLSNSNPKPAFIPVHRTGFSACFNKFVFAKKCFHLFPTDYFSVEFIQQ